jgi:hypothetical protein
MEPGCLIYGPEKDNLVFRPLEIEKLEELRERSGVINCLIQFLEDQVDIKRI